MRIPIVYGDIVSKTFRNQYESEGVDVTAFDTNSRLVVPVPSRDVTPKVACQVDISTCQVDI